MNEIKFLVLFFMLFILALAPFASADIPHLISLQGKLTDASDNPISSSTNFVFKIYPSETGGTALWTESRTGANAIVPDTLGIFSALLGSATALNIPFNESYWLEVQVNSEVLSPRTRMGSAGYALRSESPWNTTGNNIYTTNSGNVGIGTATPAQKLTVGGDVSWTGALQGGSVPWARLSVFPSACPAGQYASAVGSSLACSAPAAGISGSGTANYLPKWTGGTTLGNSVIYDNGNVGIGTTSPGAKLTVAGTIESTSGGIKFPDGTTQTKAGIQYDAQGRIPSGKLGFTQKVYKNNAGNSVFHANDAAAGGGVGLQKTKETKLNKVPDNTLKIYFECSFNFDAGNWAGYAQIYRNGGAVGTVRGCSYGWSGFTETISGWNDGDLLQIYTWMGGGGGNYRSVSAQNLRILGTIEEELIQSVQ